MDERTIAIELDRAERRLGEALETIRLIRRHLENAAFAAAVGAEPLAPEWAAVPTRQALIETAPIETAPATQPPAPPARVERRLGRDRRSGGDRRKAVLDGLAARIILATARDRRTTFERRSGIDRREAAA